MIFFTQFILTVCTWLIAIIMTDLITGTLAFICLFPLIYVTGDFLGGQYKTLAIRLIKRTGALNDK